MSIRQNEEEETNPVLTVTKTIFFAILTGVGIAIGFYIIKNKLGMKS